jgi:hypothetical protein
MTLEQPETIRYRPRREEVLCVAEALTDDGLTALLNYLSATSPEAA